MAQRDCYLFAVALLLGVQVCMSGPPSRSRFKASTAKQEPATCMNQASVRLAYQLMDVMNAFPVDVVSTCSPLAWRVAEAVGKATSLHVSCVYVHMVILISLVLSGVQVKYGGILGKFSNPLMIHIGAPGAGKSIIMRLFPCEKSLPQQALLFSLPRPRRASDHGEHFGAGETVRACNITIIHTCIMSKVQARIMAIILHVLRP